MENNSNHPKIKFGKTGVLIINLGTPDSTSWFDIRKYLKEFLSDRRVIEVNPFIWQIILNLIILNLIESRYSLFGTQLYIKLIYMNPTTLKTLICNILFSIIEV